MRTTATTTPKSILSELGYEISCLSRICILYGGLIEYFNRQIYHIGVQGDSERRPTEPGSYS